MFVHVQLLLLWENTADSSVCSNSFKGCSGIGPGHLNTKLSPLCVRNTYKEAQSCHTEYPHELCAVGLKLHLASMIHLMLDDFQS